MDLEKEKQRGLRAKAILEDELFVEYREKEALKNKHETQLQKLNATDTVRNDYKITQIYSTK